VLINSFNIAFRSAVGPTNPSAILAARRKALLANFMLQPFKKLAESSEPWFEKIGNINDLVTKCLCFVAHSPDGSILLDPLLRIYGF
jgi:hypothetical protein